MNNFLSKDIRVTAGLHKLTQYGGQALIMVTLEDGESVSFPYDIFVKLFKPNTEFEENLLAQWKDYIYPPAFADFPNPNDQYGFPKHGVEIEQKKDGKMLMKPARPELKPVK